MAIMSLANIAAAQANKTRNAALSHIHKPFRRAFKPFFDVGLNSDIMNPVNRGLILFGNSAQQRKNKVIGNIYNAFKVNAEHRVGKRRPASLKHQNPFRLFGTLRNDIADPDIHLGKLYKCYPEFLFEFI